MDEDGTPVKDDSFYVMFNAHSSVRGLRAARVEVGRSNWTIMLDTSELPDHVDVDKDGRAIAAGEKLHGAAVVARPAAPPQGLMRGDPVQKSYRDALGHTRRPSAAALRALHRALGKGRDHRAPTMTTASGPLVVTEGETLALDGADIRLEDGSDLVVDARLPADLPIGYHTIVPRGRGDAVTLIVAPRSCYLPDDYRVWGWAIQLYAARSTKSWGIGDLADLRSLGRWSRAQGARIALVNPLAAATPTLPQQPSPYFPTSRRFRNALFLRIEEVDGAKETDGVAAIAQRARALNQARSINRDAVFALKFQALEAIWSRVRRRRYSAFDRFVTDGGGALADYALFCALAERYGTGWHGWPAALQQRHPAALARASADVAIRDRIRFHQWIQFELDRQLAAASREVPVMQDLPIGFDADGADAWAFQDVLAEGVSVGAPPDEFNSRGQNWGLPPFVPAALRRANYAPFIETIRACLRHAGGLRIDHVMGLMRLFWIPAGREAADGAYVSNDADQLLVDRRSREPPRPRGHRRRGSRHRRRRLPPAADGAVRAVISPALVRKGAAAEVPGTGAGRDHDA